MIRSLLPTASLLVLPLLLLWHVSPAGAQGRAVPDPFDGATDVGEVGIPGSTRYDAAAQTLTITGSGANMWFGQDEFHFVWKRMRGDFILTTRAHLLGKGVDPHRKLGWMVRSTLDPSSAHVSAAVHGDGLAALQFRRAAGDSTRELRSAVQAPDVIQLERKGGTYTMSVARFGETFRTVQVSDVGLGDEVYVGLFVCAHNDTVTERGLFRNVRITVPAREGFTPYRDYIGSNVEIMEVATGSRRIVHRSPLSLQAPNWTLDGRALIYNSGGRLFRFDLARRTPTPIDTDFATRNNNDHVLSPDGRTIGISNSSPEENQSVVYTVPIGGGRPRRVTPLAPSYLHGWSPDGRFLIYTAQRGGDWDIYRIPAQGGEEENLTRSPGLDDGSEYTPDGRYIYFNSARTGRMQIWRMRPDGSDQEQVTHDDYNNWFPHISPDGRWVVFLSYPKEVRADDHPWYKPVYLRVMPVTPGAPRVVAYLYGGQGTINVPSWSPDSRHIAFVSNTDMSEAPRAATP